MCGLMVIMNNITDESLNDKTDDSVEVVGLKKQKNDCMPIE